MPKSDNKLFRSQLRSKTKFTVGETEPSIDDQLTRLEEDIRRLKIEFDVFFNGASKRPPYDTKGRVETMIKRLGDAISVRCAGLALQRLPRSMAAHNAGT